MQRRAGWGRAGRGGGVSEFVCECLCVSVSECACVSELFRFVQSSFVRSVRFCSHNLRPEQAGERARRRLLLFTHTLCVGPGAAAAAASASDGRRGGHGLSSRSCLLSPTCNQPIPQPPGLSRFRSFSRLLPALRYTVCPRACALVAWGEEHGEACCWLAGGAPACVGAVPFVDVAGPAFSFLLVCARRYARIGGVQPMKPRPISEARSAGEHTRGARGEAASPLLSFPPAARTHAGESGLAGLAARDELMRGEVKSGEQTGR